MSIELKNVWETNLKNKEIMMNWEKLFGTLLAFCLLLLFLTVSVTGAEESVQTKFNEKIGGWEKLLTELTQKKKMLVNICNSPVTAKKVNGKIESKINPYALEAIIKNAKERGYLLPREKEEGDLVAGKINDVITIITSITSGSDLTTFIVSPISGITVLPDNPLVPGVISNEIKIMAAQGEYEPASFVLYSKSKLSGLTIKASDLKGTKGETIPSSCIDLKVVKCWYQTGTNWDSGSFNEGLKVLVPELLLNDDTLVKVDTEKKENYLKWLFRCFSG